jgi:serine/threonine protein kinase
MENFQTLEIPEATLYMAEMIDAVKTLHSLGYIHRYTRF